jgi:hypothetical protein
MRSRCSAFPAVIYLDVVPSLSNYIQQPGTLGTLGIGLKRNGFGLDRAWNKTGNSGNELVERTGRRGADRCPLYDRLGSLE